MGQALAIAREAAVEGSGSGSGSGSGDPSPNPKPKPKPNQVDAPHYFAFEGDYSPGKGASEEGYGGFIQLTGVEELNANLERELAPLVRPEASHSIKVRLRLRLRLRVRLRVRVRVRVSVSVRVSVRVSVWVSIGVSVRVSVRV